MRKGVPSMDFNSYEKKKNKQSTCTKNPEKDVFSSKTEW